MILYINPAMFKLLGGSISWLDFDWTTELSYCY